MADVSDTTGLVNNKFDDADGGDRDDFSVQDSDGGMDENFTMSQTGNTGFSGRGLPPKQYTKLETISGQTIRSMMYGHNVALAVGVIYTLIFIALSVTVWASKFQNPADDSQILTSIPSLYRALSGVVMFLIFLYLLTLTVLYWVHVIRLLILKQSVVIVMGWVMMLTACMTIYLNPFAVFFDNDLTPNASPDGFPYRFMTSLQNLAFSLGTTFYIWCSVHSYRYLEERPKIWFYVPKVFLCAAVMVVRIVAFKYSVFFAEIPFISGIRLLTLGLQKEFFRRATYLTIALTTLELITVIWIICDIFRTRAYLKKKDYMQWRSKQIGFRFFLYLNLTFYVIFWLTALVLYSSVIDAKSDIMYLGGFYYLANNSGVAIGLALMLCSYITVTVTVNQSAFASKKLLPCLGPQTPNPMDSSADMEPITYRSTEPSSIGGQSTKDMHSNCFTMQTHVIMFNFAWLVYYYGTKKFETLQLKKDVFDFEIAAYFTDKPTDTHVIVVDGTDRIVVSFRGTTSGKNLKTDIRISQRPLTQVVPSQELASPSQQVTALVGSKQWRRARVHSGFAAAYASVSEALVQKIQDLYAANRRPIYLTGHSLGGSLATLCSLDLMVVMGLHNSEVFVSTFGAPRLGNKVFQEMYDAVVSSCWRIVVGPDMVAKLPGVGYKHCGKKVLLTADGDMFIDPNALELKLWSGEKPGMLYHRKASYLLAMRTWCDLNHGESYVPEFWAWPFSPDDSRRFSQRMNSQSTSSSVYSSKRTERRENRGTRLLQRDAMISQLHGSARTPPQMWADLTRKVLAQDTRTFDDY